jgi:hypothetical protein
VGDYTPVYVEGEIITLTTGAAVKGGDLLVVTGVNQVSPFIPAANPVPNFVGIASSDAPVSGRVSFYCRGPVHESIADGTVTAGDQICTAATALTQVRTATPASTPATEPAAYTPASTVADLLMARSVIGVALTTATAGNKVRWMMLV